MLTAMGNETGEAPSQPVDEPTSGQAKSGWSSWPLWTRLAVVFGPLIVIVITVVIWVNVAAASADPFADALDECDLRAGGDARILDDGRGLVLDMEGDESGGLSLASVVCVLVQLDVPDSTLTKMEGTRALDGRQSDEFDGMTIEWTYHPSDGMDVLLTR